MGGGDYIPSDIADSLGIEVKIRTKWEKDEFVLMLHSVVKYGDNYFSELNEKENLIEEKLYLDHSGYYELRTFKLINNKWFLIKYVLHNF